MATSESAKESLKRVLEEETPGAVAPGSAAQAAKAAELEARVQTVRLETEEQAFRAMPLARARPCYFFNNYSLFTICDLSHIVYYY